MMATSPTEADVIVVGAGIAGVAASRALHLKGFRSLLIERRVESVDGLAVNLPGNAIAALGALGLGEEVRQRGRAVRRREYRTDRDRLLFAVDEDAFWGMEMRPHCMRRSDLLSMLAKDLPAGMILRGSEVTAISQQKKTVVAELSNGATISGRLLIGADGVGSATRRAIFGASQPAAARLAGHSWRFMVPNPGVDCWTLWAGGEALILLIPVDDHHTYGWAAATRSHDAPIDPATLTNLIRSFPTPARKAFEDAQSSVGTLHHSPLEEVRPDRWGSGRVVLIGDAAHATAPVWAEGAALAMEDALVLAALLDANPGAAETSLELQARQGGRVKHVQAMTDRMSRAARLPSVVRNMLLPFVGPRSYESTYGPLRAAVV